MKMLAESPLPDGAQRLWLGYSGGLDSMVLLHALSRLYNSGRVPALQALHVHHGLQAVADDWVAHCAAQCAALGVELQVLHVHIDPSDADGPEAAARRARYEALAAAMAPGDVLATAHQLDDQAETFLMRALRGSGARGLAAMRPLQRFGPGWLWRPLLGRGRGELEAYAQQHGLAWIEDPHNADPRYERSWLRREVTPLLRRRWPAATRSLARSAALSAEADDLLTELAVQDHALCAAGAGLGCAALRTLSPARQRNLLRVRIDALGLPPATHGVLLRLDDLLQSAADATPLLAWPGGELRRYRDVLWMMPRLAAEPGAWSADWDGRGVLVLPPGCGELHGCDDEQGDSGGPRRVRVGFARGGEGLVMHANGPRRPLKNLFQEHGVPPWQRRRTPLLYQQGELRWVGGLPLPGSADAFHAGLVWRR